MPTAMGTPRFTGERLQSVTLDTLCVSQIGLGATAKFIRTRDRLAIWRYRLPVANKTASITFIFLACAPGLLSSSRCISSPSEATPAGILESRARNINERAESIAKDTQKRSPVSPTLLRTVRNISTVVRRNETQTSQQYLLVGPSLSQPRQTLSLPWMREVCR